jgi:hypothetical protein
MAYWTLLLLQCGHGLRDACSPSPGFSTHSILWFCQLSETQLNIMSLTIEVINCYWYVQRYKEKKYMVVDLGLHG